MKIIQLRIAQKHWLFVMSSENLKQQNNKSQNFK